MKYTNKYFFKNLLKFWGRDRTNRDFCDPIRLVMLLLNQPVDRQKLSAVDRQVDWQNSMPRETRKAAV